MNTAVDGLQGIGAAFEALYTTEARVATAPLLCLAAGVVLFLLCDVLDALRAARAPVFVAALAAAFYAELVVLGAERVPGAVLGGTFIADRSTALWGVLFLLGTLFSWMIARGYYKESLPFLPEHDVLLLTAPIGMLLMVGANDLIVFFVGLELLSIPLYALAAFRRSRAESVEAGLKYFLLGSFSSALFLYGAALLYASSGSLALGALLERDLSAPLALAGLALLAASLFFKVAVFPFHLWAPDVYQGSPTPVTALMATGTKAAAFGFLIVHLTPLLPQAGSSSVALLALITMALGNLGALVQGDLKRMLAYSSVAHAGTLLLLVAASMGGPDRSGALQAALYYLGGYTFTALGAFGLVAALERDGSTRLDSLRGLARSRPFVSALLALFMLSLGGIPATAGFLGKWFVFSVLVREGMLVTAVLGALLSIVALGYYLRVIVVLFMQPAPEGAAVPVAERPWGTGLAAAACAVLVLALGLFPAAFLGLLGP